MVSETLDRYVRLFRGRGDAYGSWEGGSIKEPLTIDLFQQHLEGTNRIGVYPLVPNGNETLTSWGCIDIDGGDFPSEGATEQEGYDRKNPYWHDWTTMTVLAQNLKLVLHQMRVYAYSEKTVNGIHIWVFPEDGLIDARYMRRTLMAACSACDYDPREVNPKQETISVDQLGNYVRLPYPGDHTRADDGAVAGNIHGVPPRTFYAALIKPEESQFRLWTLEQFLDGVKLTSGEALRDASRLWVPPKVDHFNFDHQTTLSDEVRNKMSGYAYTMWKDGPLDGADRSSTLVRLAGRCIEDGMVPSEVFEVVWDADGRWGKFHDREDGEQQVHKIIEWVGA